VFATQRWHCYKTITTASHALVKKQDKKQNIDTVMGQLRRIVI
jgi:hypothetical protein